MPNGVLAIDHVWKSFGAEPVLRGIDIAVPEYAVMALLGPSGCGKSTLLRIISGLESVDQGRVLFGDKDVTHVPVHERGFGLMFQDLALFPHRTVAENVGFGLKMQHASRLVLNTRVDEMLDLVDLAGYAQRSIWDLSGGQRQRVALARALAPKPRLLLLDEPLSSLDRTLRERLTLELRQIIKHQQITAVYVTHDQSEAFTVADQVVVMQDGMVAQQGAPQAIYTQPASPFVARFLSLNNLLPCTHIGTKGDLQVVQTPLGTLTVAAAAPHDAAFVLVRPEAPYAGSENLISGVVEQVSFRGDTFRIMLNVHPDTTLELEVLPTQSVRVGDQLRVTLDPQAMSFVPD